MERLLDKQWIAKAITVQIETPPVVDGREDMWSYGYGYQFWKTPYEESYRAHGAHGQITVVLPKEGWVIAVQCPENGDFERVKKALHEHVFVPQC